MNTYASQSDDTVLLLESRRDPLDKDEELIRNDLSQIKTLHSSYKKKNRRSKSEYHDRMKQLLEYDTTKLVYLLSTVFFVLLIAVIVGLIYFSESFLMYSIFISTLSALFIMITCIKAIAANSKRKRIKMFGKF